tara:strand:+ start:20 stop:262 length:243 start_codon:yes stop_codon:yes gene_type:complete
MKLLTYLIYTLLITCFLACNPKPSHKRKMEWKKHKLEQRDSIRNHHPDSLIKRRDKRVALRKKKDCCAKCGCENNNNPEN